MNKKVKGENQEEIIELGIDPYPPQSFETNTTKRDKDNFNEEKNFSDVTVAGRLMSRRVMGSASFAEIQTQW